MIIEAIKRTLKSVVQHVDARYYYFLIIFIVTVLLLWYRPRKLIIFLLFALYLLFVAFMLHYLRDGYLKHRILFGMFLPLILLALLLISENGKLPIRIPFFMDISNDIVKTVFIMLAISSVLITTYHYKEGSMLKKMQRDRTHKYLTHIEELGDTFCVQRTGNNPLWIYKNPPDQSNQYILFWFIGSPINKDKIEKYSGIREIGIYNIFNQDIIWYFGESQEPKEGPIVESFYKSNYPNCRVNKDTILVAETYNLYRYTFFIPSTDSLSREYPAMGDSVQAREEEEQTIKP